MPKPRVDFKIFPIKNGEAFNAYNNLRIENNGLKTIDKNIAATEFNKNFAIIVRPEDEHECMKYFSPELQLQMIKSKYLCEYAKLTISSEVISVQLKQHLEAPLAVDVFTKRSILNDFLAVEDYCSHVWL